MDLIAAIGLEIHVQLATRTKAFCGCPVEPSAPPNHFVCPVCAGFPGALPVPNRRMVSLALRLGRALGCELRPVSVFTRKHYLYPDLPRGYQITQHERPLCVGGRLPVLTREGGWFELPLRRIHLEDDAGRLIHGQDEGGAPATWVDLGRAGVPLAEIVTEATLRSPEQVGDALKALHTLVVWLGVSHGQMEEGNLRVDANVSVGPAHTGGLGPRVELKNINSFRYLRRAVELEIERQLQGVRRGEVVSPHTRGYDPARGQTFALRPKEGVQEYLYLDDPDLPSLRLGPDDLDGADLGPLPWEVARALLDLGAPVPRVLAVVGERDRAAYVMALLESGAPAPAAVELFCGELLARLGGAPVDRCPIPPAEVAALLCAAQRHHLPAQGVRRALDRRWGGEAEMGEAIADEIAAGGGDDGLEALAREVVRAFPREVEALAGGRRQVLSFLMGQAMRRVGGRADAARLSQIIERLAAQRGE